MQPASKQQTVELTHTTAALLLVACLYQAKRLCCSALSSPNSTRHGMPTQQQPFARSMLLVGQMAAHSPTTRRHCNYALICHTESTPGNKGCPPGLLRGQAPSCNLVILNCSQPPKTHPVSVGCVACEDQHTCSACCVVSICLHSRQQGFVHGRLATAKPHPGVVNMRLHLQPQNKASRAHTADESCLSVPVHVPPQDAAFFDEACIYTGPYSPVSERPAALESLQQLRACST